MNQEWSDFVWQRSGGRCEYCHFPADVSWLPFQIDHVISEKHGGPTSLENLALSCYYCNSFKGPNIAGIDPEGLPDQAVQLFHH
jgi:5-methylcytosine-specific restriction endonuclease McrA